MKLENKHDIQKIDDFQREMFRDYFFARNNSEMFRESVRHSPIFSWYSSQDNATYSLLPQDILKYVYGVRLDTLEIIDMEKFMMFKLKYL